MDSVHGSGFLNKLIDELHSWKIPVFINILKRGGPLLHYLAVAGKGLPGL